MHHSFVLYCVSIGGHHVGLPLGVPTFLVASASVPLVAVLQAK